MTVSSGSELQFMTLRAAATAAAQGKRWLEAEALYFCALQAAADSWGRESASAGLISLDLSDLYETLGSADEAGSCFRRAVDILRPYARELVK